MIEELIERAKQISHSKQGSNSICFCFVEYVLLYGSIDRNNIDRNIDAINSYIERGFNIAPILEYRYDADSEISTYANGDSFQKGWTLQSRANGTELERRVSDIIHISSLDSFNEQYLEMKRAKQKFIDLLIRQTSVDASHLRKFITDYQTILEEGVLQVDPSKSTNFFYDEQKGFTFIDIGINNPPYEKSDQFTYLPDYILINLFPQFPYLKIQEDNISNSNSIFLVVPLTEEEFEIIQNAEQKLTNQIIQIFIDLGWNEDEIKRIITNKLTSRKKEDVYPDEETLYKALANQFSTIVSYNRASGLKLRNNTEVSAKETFTIEL